MKMRESNKTLKIIKDHANRSFIAKESGTIKIQNLFTNCGVKYAMLFPFGKRLTTIEGNTYLLSVLCSPRSHPMWAFINPFILGLGT